MAPANRSLIPYLNALAAMLVYGAWAIFANFEHGRSAWLMAGVIQGIYAFGSTLTVTVVARWAYLRAGAKLRGILCGFGLSFLVMLIIPVAVHSIAGTPNILQTILPGLIWGSGYLIGYLLLTEKNSKKTKP